MGKPEKRPGAGQAEDERLLHELSDRLLEISDNAVFFTDAELRLRRANPSFYRMFGSEQGEVEGTPLLSILFEDEEDPSPTIETILRGRGHWEGEVRTRSLRGEARNGHLKLAVVQSDEGRPRAYVGILRDITDLHSARAIIEYSANHDALTGLPNRDWFLATLEGLAGRIRSEGGKLAVCIVDLDDFKRVNNDLSRETGDLLLRSIGSRLAGTLRAGDIIARTGGDEFSLAFPLRSESEIHALASRILSIFERPFDADSRLIYVNATMGVSLCPEHGKEAERLSSCADLALQGAKGGGKKSYAIYREDLGAKLHGKASLASELRAAMEGEGAGGRFYVHYQPIVSIASGEVGCAEALARWHHPVRGPISPAQFIPLAEETNLIVDLGAFVLSSVCNQARAWASALDRPPCLCINVSVRQLQDPAFIDLVRREIAGLPGGLVTLEITESQLFEDLDDGAATLSRLKDAGVLLSVDDFGTGYASFSYLRKLPIDIVKIDQSFVADLARDRHDRRIVEAVTMVARELGARTVAEGVETKAQFDLLREIGCDYAQGFLFSPPISPEGIPGLVGGTFDGADFLAHGAAPQPRAARS
jgi:diguanylate cyclase (GGDEF)-like protein/PAS domain S-box-containing protein